MVCRVVRLYLSTHLTATPSAPLAGPIHACLHVYPLQVCVADLGSVALKGILEPVQVLKAMLRCGAHGGRARSRIHRKQM